MSAARFVHLYLAEAPEDREIQTRLEFYGFKHLRSEEPDGSSDPLAHFWAWRHSPLSGNGFKLTYFDGVFPDDRNYKTAGAVVWLEASKASSPHDLAYLDIITKFLLDRFGGHIRNPNDPTNSTYLCGKPQKG